MSEPRVISKPDGTVVTIHPGGETVIAKPGGLAITYKADGTVVREEPDGSVRSFQPKRSIPRSQRPLNVVSKCAEEIGRLMSNFANTPFELDGIRYASVEGFYVSLKYSGDPERQREVRQMFGPAARDIGSKSKAKTASYQGVDFDLGGEVHHALVKRAIRAKLEQNPEVAAAFAATYPRPIVHDLGRPERRGTFLPGAVFTRILTELRQELIGQAQRRKARGEI